MRILLAMLTTVIPFGVVAISAMDSLPWGAVLTVMFTVGLFRLMEEIY